MSDAFRSISQQFLSGLPVRKIDFTNIIKDLVDPTSGENNQDMLLSLTVDHPLVIKYPSRIEYQQSFMRKLVKELEDKSAEISSNLYERLVQILQSKDTDNIFRHYSLEDGSVISLKESASIISNGTTGLCVWQAAHVLINWCFAHKELLRGSTILELGSGAGLCGIAVSSMCKPLHYIFSDCHPAVMNILIDNVKINHGAEGTITDCDPFVSPLNGRIMWSGNLQESKVSVAHLPWEDIVEENLATAIIPNYVIASDVVYDPSLFDALANTLRDFVNAGSHVVLTCTERNSETLLQFLKALDVLELKVREELTPETNIIPVDNNWTVKIYRITKL